MISKKEINYIADLCKIGLSDEEIEDFTQGLERTLGHLEILNELDLDDVEPTYFINLDKNPLREDVVGESLPLEEVIKNAPEEKYGYFKLPNVMD